MITTFTEADKELDPSVQVGKRKPLDPEAPAIPCGLIAKSIFSDTFRLFKVLEDGASEEINIAYDDISWNPEQFSNIN